LVIDTTSHLKASKTAKIQGLRERFFETGIKIKPTLGNFPK